MDIVIENLNKSFGEKKVLSNFSFVFKENKVTCIMGESGCGKTTLLNILMGIIKCDSGIIKGISSKRIAAVFQEDRLFEGFTVYENIKAVDNRKFTREQIICELKKVGLESEIDTKVLDLSGGMKRRIAIVRAIIAESSILIMDEPFKGLDQKTKDIVIKYVKDNIEGKTVIICTHDINEAEILGQDILTINTII